MAKTRAQLDAQENASRGTETYETGVRNAHETTDARTYQTGASMPTPSTGVSQDPQRLEQEIAQTRREMAGTLDAIQRRLDPDRLKHEAQQHAEEAVERAKDKIEDATIGRVKNMTEKATQRASNWRTNVVNTVKENPVPAALVGVGLGWLIMESSSREQGYDQSRYGRRYDEYAYGGYGYGDISRSDYMRDRDLEDERYGAGYGERRGGAGQQLQQARRQVGERFDEMGRRAEETTGEVRERAQDLRGEASERIEETTDEIRQRAEHLREEAGEQWDELREETRMRARQMQYRARSQGRQVKRSAQHLMQENPLAVGAAAVALGVLVGWAVPSTETESRLVGEYRDDFVEQARHEAQAVARRAQSAAKEAVEDVKEETKQAAKQAAGEVSDESKRAAQRMRDSQ